uniref:Multiple epidermal growth factor-like domains protein 11 n=1 Tax=Aceria tosichella TaxID=561515 RepID=A0A6G1SC63_9ACAR
MYSMTNHRQANMFALLLFLSLAGIASGEPQPWTDHVCNVSVPTKKDIIVEQPVKYEIKVQSMCGLLPCVKTRLETRTDQTIKTVIQHVNKLTCCPGYAETPNRRCSPICLDPCGPAGKCVRPNICKCQPEPSESAPGFTGSTCRQFTCLASKRWGASCERECPMECEQNSYCSANTGECVCNPGWHGPNCSLECGPDDNLASGCNFISQMPPIIEPDANLLSISDTNTILSKAQKAEALMLIKDEDNNDENVQRISTSSSMSDSRAWASLASSYLIGLLSVMSLILLVAFFIVKKRYEFVRNELYHSSVASIGSGRSTGSTAGSPGSDYSTSTYYSASGATPPRPSAKNLESNLNFAAATRNILSANQLSQADGKNVLLFSPKTESHLIRSQEAAQQNIYSELDLSKGGSNVATRARALTPTMTKKNSNKEEEDADHVYQVPKRSPSKVDESSDSRVVVAADEPLLRSSDVSIDLGYNHDDDSNIYEEIKPRNGGKS